MVNGQKKIFTVFAGRRNNIDIQRKYLVKALEMGILDEVHYWNITRNKSDEDYLKQISNLKRSSSTNFNYIQIYTPIVDNSFELNVKASNDVHIKISNGINNYEIVLGGWDNTKSVVRENGTEIFSVRTNGICVKTKYVNVGVSCSNNKLNVCVDGDDVISVWIDVFAIKDVFFKTAHGSIGTLSYGLVQNKGFYFMDTCIKNWLNYYNWYADYEYSNDIIFKSDDDVIFFDLKKFPNFIDFINSNDYDLVFANIINNGVSAYFQQNKLNLIPKSLMNLEYPIGGECGSLWESGTKAETLHNYFIDNYTDIIGSDFKGIYYKIDTRFSINFFGYKGKNWHRIKDLGRGDDEYNLTVEGVKKKGFVNMFYADFIVAHLSFWKQEATGINNSVLRERYDKLADELN
jgi:hypothetical protein